MAFAQAGWERVGHGVYKYETTDTNATVVASGYFNTIADLLQQWDVICVVSETGGTPKIDWIAVTSASKAATVTTTVTET